MEQDRTTIFLVIFGALWLAIQTVLSFTGDYWFTRVSPETDNYGFDRVFRWVQGNREIIVVTAPHYIETWKRLWVASTLDVLSASTSLAFWVTIILWQLWHGAQIASCLPAVATAVLCKLAGSSYWKGENDDTYDPRKIWWYNFFHFCWHLFGNIAVYKVAYDLCHNGLRGVT